MTAIQGPQQLGTRPPAVRREVARPPVLSVRERQTQQLFNYFDLLERLWSDMETRFQAGNFYDVLRLNYSYLNVAYQTIELMRVMGEDTQVLETLYVRAKVELVANYLHFEEKDEAVKNQALSLVENINDTSGAVSTQKYASEGYLRLCQGRIALIRELADYVEEWGLFDGQMSDIRLYCFREVQHLNLLSPPARQRIQPVKILAVLPDPQIRQQELDQDEARQISELAESTAIKETDLDGKWLSSIRSFILSPQQLKREAVRQETIRKLINRANELWVRLAASQKTMLVEILEVAGIEFSFENILLNMPESLVEQATGDMLTLITTLFDMRIALRIGRGTEIVNAEIFDCDYTGKDAESSGIYPLAGISPQDEQAQAA